MLKSRYFIGLFAGLALASLAVAGCSDDDGDGDGNGVTATSTSESPAGGAATTDVRLVASNISLDLETITVPAGEEVTITYDNQDTGLQHNLQVQAGDAEFRTEVEQGPITQTLTFTIDEPGSYSFRCEVHPGAMNGTLVVE